MAKLSGFANTLEEALGPIDFPVHSRQEEPTTRQAAERQRGAGGGRLLPGQVRRGPEAPADPPSSAFFLSAALRALEAASVPEPARPATLRPPRGGRHRTACRDPPQCVEGEQALPQQGV